MDIEKARRAELIEALDGYFLCFEEVKLRHALMSKHCVRADVVAIPLDKKFWGFAVAFEVKEPNAKDRNAAKWIHAIRQASDYVYASIEPEKRSDNLHEYVGRRVSGAFIFPAPNIGLPNNLIDREGDRQLFVGAMQLGLHLRVGGAGWEQTGIGPRLRLAFGPNDVWRSDVGFCFTGPSLLSGKRTLGSQKVDVMAELDGIGHKIAYPSFE